MDKTLPHDLLPPGMSKKARRAQSMSSSLSSSLSSQNGFSTDAGALPVFGSEAGSRSSSRASSPAPSIGEAPLTPTGPLSQVAQLKLSTFIRSMLCARRRFTVSLFPFHRLHLSSVERSKFHVKRPHEERRSAGSESCLRHQQHRHSLQHGVVDASGKTTVQGDYHTQVICVKLVRWHGHFATFFRSEHIPIEFFFPSASLSRYLSLPVDVCCNSVSAYLQESVSVCISGRRSYSRFR